MDFAAAKKLQESGFTDEQVEALSLVLKSDLATKEDIKSLDMRLSAQIKQLELKITISRYITIVAIPAILVALKKLGIM